MTRCSGLVALVLSTLGPGASALTAECDAPIDLGRGRISFHVPAAYDPASPTPLLILLHGYGASGAVQESYMRLTPLADEMGFLYAYPDGVPDPLGRRFWNATDACCNYFFNDIDHSAYLRALVEAIRAQCNVDRYRIYFAGHSNGGFMSYRMACDHAEVIAGVASLAGATFAEPSACRPAKPVHVLQIHGTADATVLYEGGSFGTARYPGAVETTELWSRANDCSPGTESAGPALNLDTSIPGRESVATRHGDMCRPGGSAELWTIEEGSHVPALSRGFRRGLIEHLLARPSCRRERLKPVRCNGAGKLTVRLRRGVPGDGYRVLLSTGEVLSGALDAKGRATLRPGGPAAGPGSVTVDWSCGARATRSFDCR